MELRHLRYFVAVAEELHFRRAAERLHIAQPAVSQQIRNLEAELGVELFCRTQRRVTLTPAGTALLKEARRVLTQAEIAQRAARHAHNRALAQVRIGYLPDAFPAVVPRLLRWFSSMTPELTLLLETGAAHRLLEDVREGRLDIAIVCLPAPVSGLRSAVIGQEGVVAAVPCGHPCASAGEIQLSGLGNTPLVHLPRSVNPAFYDGVLGACRAAGIAPAMVEIGQPAIEQVLLTVACGAGVALLPESTAERFATAGVRFLPLTTSAPVFDVAVVARKDAGAGISRLLTLAGQAKRLAHGQLVAA